MVLSSLAWESLNKRTKSLHTQTLREVRSDRTSAICIVYARVDGFRVDDIQESPWDNAESDRQHGPDLQE